MNKKDLLWVIQQTPVQKGYGFGVSKIINKIK